ncbi:NADPH-dependent F420 reductase [Leifsonia sp. AG29]|uniref:NADPH-dependent F420 reductase n=1 Tax=Leifsonia sp. AG29 TaxID=2598860 RepID=UPI00131CBF64|nr:NAD(P)-binding domain-containing protein [Leifsonia sp. AG29]
MRVAVFGYGKVGKALVRSFAGAGEEVVVVDSDHHPGAAREALDAEAETAPELAAIRVAPAEDALADADVVVIAVPFGAIPAVARALVAAHFSGAVIDATNPVGPGLTHGLGMNESASTVLAAAAPEVRVVKSLNIYGWENLAPGVAAGAAPSAATAGASAPAAHVAEGEERQRPLMPYAGDDVAAKETVRELLDRAGWEPLDVGPLAAAVDLEHLALLWVRMVRAGGADPHLRWALFQG